MILTTQKTLSIDDGEGFFTYRQTMGNPGMADWVGLDMSSRFITWVGLGEASIQPAGLTQCGVRLEGEVDERWSYRHSVIPRVFK
jgi:hypothetical protein